MPKKSPAKLSVKEREQYFVSLYVKQGAKQEKIAYCEKRAQLKAGSALKLLARKSVQKEIAARMIPVQVEQVRQQTITDSVAAAKAQFERQLSEALDHIKLHKLDFDVLQGRLMQGVIGIDMHRSPEALLEYIKTAMVVHGSLQAGNTKRVIPAEENKENPAALVYTSLFNRTSSSLTNPPNSSESEPDAPEEASDLYPQPSLPAPVVPKTIPLPGEPVDEPPPAKPSDPNVITVEVG